MSRHRYQASQVVEASQVGLLVVQHPVGLVLRDGEQELVLPVGEVVEQLALAGPGARPHVVQRRGRDPLLPQDLGGPGDDAGPRGQPLRCQIAHVSQPSPNGLPSPTAHTPSAPVPVSPGPPAGSVPGPGSPSGERGTGASAAASARGATLGATGRGDILQARLDAAVAR